MISEQQIIYLNKSYKILASEQEFIIHPAAFDLLPSTKLSLLSSFSCTFHIEDFKLYLDLIMLHMDEINEKIYEFKDCMIAYNGTILIAANMVKDFHMKSNKLACFSYQSVLELVFEDGILITTIDQSKAMLRIRKNIDLGLRCPTKGRDIRCIKRFLNSSFVGDYNSIRLLSRKLKQLKEMKEDYQGVDYFMK